MGIIVTEISSVVMSIQPETEWEKLEYDFRISFLISDCHKINEIQQHINEFDIQIHEPYLIQLPESSVKFFG